MPNSWEALFVIAIAIAPGYLAIKVFSWVRISDKRDSTQTIVDSIIVSLMSYSLVVPLIIWMLQAFNTWFLHHPFLSMGCIAGAVLVLPSVIGYVWGRILAKCPGLYQKLKLRHSTPCSWDYRFGLSKPLWVRVTLQNGDYVCGYWGKNSFASSFPNERDLYLEELWTAGEDGKFLEKSDALTAGAWIPGEQIMFLEFYQMSQPPKEGEGS